MTTEFQRQNIAGMSDAELIVDYVACCLNYHQAYSPADRLEWDSGRRLAWAELGYRGIRDQAMEALKAEREKTKHEKTGTQQ